MKLEVVLIFTFVVLIDCKTFDVSSSEELNDALISVNPGDTINLKDGTYNGTFVTEQSGTSEARITLKGSKKAVLSGPSYGFWLKGDYWHLEGFSVSNAKKGIVIEGASNCILDDLEVGNILQEGIHFRYNSTDNILRNSKVHNTGLGSPAYGEGVYIGQAVSNWIDKQQDKSDRNQILNNYIGPNVAAESIDIKEGSCCGLIQDNTFDGTGEAGKNSADSWVDVKGDSYLITNNTGTNSIKDGFQIHHISRAGVGGCDNTIENNHCIDITGKCVTNNSHGCTNTIEDNYVD